MNMKKSKLRIPIDLKLCDVNIHITSLDTPITGNIIAFVELNFLTDSATAIVGRGFTLKVIEVNRKAIFKLNAPAYRSKYKMNASFIIEDKIFWKRIEEAVIEEHLQITGGLSAEECLSKNEIVLPNEIPL
jgi:hypothetical protein